MTTTMTHDELQKIFADKDLAREYLEQQRWANGVICPHCGTKNSAYRLTPKEGSKTPVRKGVWKCGACRKQFTVTVGTIFADSHIPLNKWLHAIYLMNSSKKGISAYQLHRMLGITSKSAWFMCHRIRYAMTQSPLAEKMGNDGGMVEVDETYIGGKNTGKGKSKRLENKTPVVVIVERDGESRATKMENVTADNVKDYIYKHVDDSAIINTDTNSVYNNLGAEYGGHERVNHTKLEYARGLAHINTAESWFALLKRGVIGTFHHVSAKHLDRYASEFSFRWSHRKTSDHERAIVAIRAVGGKRLMYKTLIAK